MDHSDHDHSAHHDHDHDHSGHDTSDPCGGGHSMHAMVFHSGVCQEILFTGWNTTNVWELLGSALVILVAGILYEGLKYYREALHSRATTPVRDSQVNITKTECGSNGTCAGPPVVKYTMFSCPHFIQTLLHVLQSTASYILMLVFMTYNVWLCIALILGLAIGYFCFGWRKTSVVDVTEHCQ